MNRRKYRVVWAVLALLTVAGCAWVWYSRRASGGAVSQQVRLADTLGHSGEGNSDSGSPQQSPTLNLVASVRALGTYSLDARAAGALAADGATTLVAILDKSGIGFEDVALRKGLHLPGTLGTGSPEVRLHYWQQVTAYFHTVDIDTTTATVHVRDPQGKHLVGEIPGRPFTAMTRHPDQRRAILPVYEIVLNARVRSGTRAGTMTKLGLLMTRDAPDGSWRLCGTSHYDVPQGEARPIMPIPYPPKLN